MSSFRRGVALHNIDILHSPNDEDLHHPIDNPGPTSWPSSSPQQEKHHMEKDLEGVGMQRLDTKLSNTPEEKLWEDDIVTFDSKDDPQNPKNWSYGRKASVTMLFGLTSS
jgi:hypothetical protein